MIELLTLMGREWEAWAWVSKLQQLSDGESTTDPAWDALAKVPTSNPLESWRIAT